MKIKNLIVSGVFLFFTVSLFAFDSLQEAVSSNTNNKNYTLSNNENVSVDLGELQGNFLIINGQNSYSVISSSKTGILVKKDKILQIDNINNYSGFYSEDNGGAIKNKGSVIIQNSTFTFNSSIYY